MAGIILQQNVSCLHYTEHRSPSSCIVLLVNVMIIFHRGGHVATEEKRSLLDARVDHMSQDDNNTCTLCTWYKYKNEQLITSSGACFH